MTAAVEDPELPHVVCIPLVHRYLNLLLPADAPAVICRAAHVNLWVRCALLVLMPITGLLATNAWGFPLSPFGVRE